MKRIATVLAAFAISSPWTAAGYDRVAEVTPLDCAKSGDPLGPATIVDNGRGFYFSTGWLYQPGQAEPWRDLLTPLRGKTDELVFATDLVDFDGTSNRALFFKQDKRTLRAEGDRVRTVVSVGLFAFDYATNTVLPAVDVERREVWASSKDTLSSKSWCVEDVCHFTSLVSADLGARRAFFVTRIWRDGHYQERGTDSRPDAARLFSWHLDERRVLDDYTWDLQDRSRDFEWGSVFTDAARTTFAFAEYGDKKKATYYTYVVTPGERRHVVVPSPAVAYHATLTEGHLAIGSFTTKALLVYDLKTAKLLPKNKLKAADLFTQTDASRAIVFSGKHEATEYSFPALKLRKKLPIADKKLGGFVAPGAYVGVAYSPQRHIALSFDLKRRCYDAAVRFE